MFKQQIRNSEPNHKCPNCGREFFNTPSNAQCYRCGEHQADRGEEAGLLDPFTPDSDGTTYENGEW